MGGGGGGGGGGLAWLYIGSIYNHVISELDSLNQTENLGKPLKGTSPTHVHKIIL